MLERELKVAPDTDLGDKKMNRITLALAAALCFATVAMNAQTYVGNIGNPDGFHVIPGSFTTNGHPYVVFCGLGSNLNASVYQSDFTTHVLDFNNVCSNVAYYDFDNSGGGLSFTAAITQNLFNSDDDFEYFEAEMVGEFITAIHIKSTNGSTLWSHISEAGYNLSPGWFFGFDVCKLDNKYYLIFGEAKDDASELKLHIYFISQSQGLTKVETELPISVFPSIVNRGQQITIELSEGNNANEVIVVNGLGQIIKRVMVEESQRQITIPTQELNIGLNVINTRTKQGQSSYKIIVR